MYSPPLDIGTESDQPTPSPWLPQPSHTTHMHPTTTMTTTCSPHLLPSSHTTTRPPPCTLRLTHGFHNHHTQLICSFMHPMATTIHLQLTHNHPSPPCSYPQLHAHPHNFTSTLQPRLFTKPIQLTHVVVPSSHTLIKPTTHKCSHTSSQLTHTPHTTHP